MMKKDVKEIGKKIIEGEQKTRGFSIRLYPS